MDKVTISCHGTAKAGEYRAQVAGEDAVGRLSWTQRGGVRVAEHTVVPPAIGGRGVAGQLVDALVADARAQGFRIDPRCSYVAAQFDHHPEWADLRV